MTHLHVTSILFLENPFLKAEWSNSVWNTRIYVFEPTAYAFRLGIDLRIVFTYVDIVNMRSILLSCEIRRGLITRK